MLGILRLVPVLSQSSETCCSSGAEQQHRRRRAGSQPVTSSASKSSNARAHEKKLNGNPHYFCATHALLTETVHWRRATSRDSSLQALVERVLGVRGCHEREVVLVDVTVLSV